MTKANQDWIAERIADLRDGALLKEDVERINELALNDEQLQSFLVGQMLNESLLEDEAEYRKSFESALSEMPLPEMQGTPQESASSPRATDSPNTAKLQARPANSIDQDSRFWRTCFLAVCVALLVSFGLHFYKPLIQLKDSAPGGIAAGGEKNFEASLTGVTECRWASFGLESNRSSRVVSSGDSIQLLEGIAAVDIRKSDGNEIRLHLEGPSGLVLNEDGLPSLIHGRLLFETSEHQGEFVVETVSGQVRCTPGSEIGILSEGDLTQIHVFSGAADLFTRMTIDGAETVRKIPISAKGSLNFARDKDGLPSMFRDSAKSNLFLVRVSMSAKPLYISPEYVTAVHESEPLAYWRFDNESPDLVRNVMRDEFHLDAEGLVVLPAGEGNFVGEFNLIHGSVDAPGFINGATLASRDSFRELLSNGYSFEMWCKPSHYHRGAVAGLLNHDPGEARPRHGFLLEVQPLDWTLSRFGVRPGSVRFLHRIPRKEKAGTSCFSDISYDPRQWQHIVATKDNTTMRLFINGEFVGSVPNTTTLDDDLQLVVGRLYPPSMLIARPFVGQMDELALYDRPLDSEEIYRHYKLARKKKSQPIARQ